VEQLAELIDRYPGLWQFFKYAVAGGIGTVIHVFLFHLFAWKLKPAFQESDWAVRALKLPIAEVDDKTRAFNSMVDNYTAFLITNFIVYVINILWVFEAGRHAWYVELLMFYLVSGISIVIGTTAMGWLIRRFGMLTSLAFCANLFSALLINYAARKFFIFKG
jgi:putative flippase GtrA